METIKAVIIEDEKKNLIALKEILKTACPNVLVLGDAGGVASARELILKLKPEIIFLDIQLDDGNAFHLLQLLEEDKLSGEASDFRIIFTTASNQHAIQAFRFSAVDYLLKPIISSEIKEAVAKATDFKISAESSKDQYKVLLGNVLKVEPDKKICLPTSEELKIYLVSDITRCEASHNYTTFYFVNDKPLMISKTIKDYEELLKDFGFIRVHQSHLINIKYVKAFVKRDGGYVRMLDGTEVPISRRKKDELLEKIKQI